MSVAFHETPPVGPALALARQIVAPIPSFETERLVLRVPEIADFPTYVDILDTPRGGFVMRQPTSREELWYDFSAMVAAWMLRGHGMWTIEAKSDRRILGFVMIGAEPGDLCHELGFWVREDVEGSGVAFDAAAVVRDWALDELCVPQLVSYIDAENSRSVALARRLGASQSADYDEDTYVYHYAKRSGVLS